jgi:hypothetical protein
MIGQYVSDNTELPPNGRDPDVEEALSIVTGRGVRIRGPMLKNETEKLAK